MLPAIRPTVHAFLPQYIGAFGNPANKVAGGDSGESIGMTAPVVMGSPSLGAGEQGSSCCQPPASGWCQKCRAICM